MDPPLHSAHMQGNLKEEYEEEKKMVSKKKEQSEN